MKGLIFGLALLASANPCLAHDAKALMDELKGDNARADWFTSLHNVDGNWCCNITDGERVPLDRVKQVGGQWYVRLTNDWQPVPPDKVVNNPKSIDGEAYVFLVPSSFLIRCFVPPTPGY